MLDSFFLALLENRVSLIHFSDEIVESSFKDVYNSPFHIRCLCLDDVIEASFKQSYLVVCKDVFRNLDGRPSFGPFAVLIHLWNDSHVGHGGVTVRLLFFSF